MDNKTFAQFVKYRGHSGHTLLEMLTAFYKEQGSKYPAELASQYLLALRKQFFMPEADNEYLT